MFLNEGEAPFIGGEEGMFHGICFDPLINAPNRPQTRHLGALNLADTLTTDVGKAVRGSPPKMGLRHDRRVTGAPGVWPLTRGAVLAQFLLCRPLGLHGPLLQSLVVFGARLLWGLGFFLHVTGP